MTAAVITVDGLTKVYGDFTAVSGVSLEVQEGEVLGILGPNGAGKTTTVECLQGLRQYDHGSVSVLGLDPARDTHQLARRIGSQLQESQLPGRIKVWEALDLVGSLSPKGPTTDELLADWGLEDKRDTQFGNLSGGQQQRLFVALALVNDPELVFLDEMTTGLDPASRHVAWDLIRRIRAGGTTVVLVTHFMDEAEALCDRLIVIDRGVVIEEGSPRELIERHATTVTVKFTASNPELEWMTDVPFVQAYHPDRERHEIQGSGPVLVHVAAALLERGLAPTDLRAERATLEDVYLALTNREAD